MFHDDSIAGGWQDLVHRIETTDALARWAVQDERLASLHDVAGDLLPLLAVGADATRADDILGALVRRAAVDGGGADDDALLLTLHLFSDWVCPMAVQLRDLAPGMVGVIVSELTCQIRSYRWRQRTRAVAAGLRWDTRRAVLGQFRPSSSRHRYRAERLLDPMSPQWQATPLGRPVTAAQGEDIDLADLLWWAARCGVEEKDIALLVRTEQARADAALNAPDDLVAAEFGLPRRTFFRHRARALDAVRAASRDYLRAVA
jgi:hypothetical protein